MTRLLLTAGIVLSLAACSTTGPGTQTASYKTNTAYAFKTGIHDRNAKPVIRHEALAKEPRLGFTGFAATQAIGGIN
ncbi:hypothetical protein HB779_09570 [Phyllobacterium sp. 628]|uniref:hypothetical protein n=1 Tax=Phyllobacterium sp. 628 TaxID=2718938 RepID=UPI00166230A6|nr:hypothetical protein [Phyllobacterium sp. 628]QND52129.1 hypothetical protein HB779_09570 [Phyllobacterium sp. 628]